MQVGKSKLKREKTQSIHIVGSGGLNPLTPHIEGIRHVFQYLPRWHFWNANEFKYFKDRNNLPNIVLLKFEEPIDVSSITVSDEPRKLPLCKINYLYSLGLFFGYAIEIPRYVVDVHKKYVGIVRQSAKREKFFSGVELLFQNDHLNVFHSELGASLITFNERYESIDPDYLRVGAKSRNSE